MTLCWSLRRISNVFLAPSSSSLSPMLMSLTWCFSLSLSSPCCSVLLPPRPGTPLVLPVPYVDEPDLVLLPEPKLSLLQRVAAAQAGHPHAYALPQGGGTGPSVAHSVLATYDQ